MLVKLLSLLVLCLSVCAESLQRSSHRALAGVDPNTLSCDPAGQIFLLLPHFTDCNKFFMCAHGVEVEFTCGGPTLVFDFELQTCAWPWQTSCQLRSLDTIEEGSGSGYDAHDELMYQHITHSRTLSEVGGEYESIINCQHKDTAANRAPYKGDCQRYWRCMNGVAQAAYCSDGLFYNHEKQQCDYEANVHCAYNYDENELEEEFIVYK